MRTPALLIALTSLAACQTETAPDSGVPNVELAERPVDLALAYVDAHTAELGVRSDTVQVTKSWSDDLGQSHVRLQQHLDGVPVQDAQAIVHLSEPGVVDRITSRFVQDIEIDPLPLYTSAEAIDLAIHAVGGWAVQTDTPTAALWVVRDADEEDHLVWKVQTWRMDGTPATSMPLVDVDAHTGEVHGIIDNFRTGSGTAYYEGSVSIETYLSGGSYYLEDTTTNVGTYTYANTTSSIYYLTDTDDVWDTAGHDHGVEAHYNGVGFVDFLSTEFGRTGPDDAGGPGYVGSITGSGYTFSLLVNYGNNYTNAGWTGSALVFGDGDGSSYDSFVALDIVAHEAGHAITADEVNFTYSGESGALDEHYGDVFASLYEADYDGATTDAYSLGEDMYTPGTAGDALRYMDDPTADGVSPDHYDDVYTGGLDNGGVHWNNGIANMAFYLASEGGTHPTYGGTMTGVGQDVTGAIWYRALTTYLTSGSDLDDLRVATMAAADDLYGDSSTEYGAVVSAWDLVGLADCHGSAINGDYNFCSAACPCEDGAGDCDSSADCDAGLSCTWNTGATYGLGSKVDVCAATDCHGASVNGSYAYCSAGCPCDAGEGDCDSSAECTSGNSCAWNVGATYSMGAGVDVCEATDCHNGQSNGQYAYCSAACPCDAGEGDCDSSSECASGLSCGWNVGASYGMAPGVDVCQ